MNVNSSTIYSKMTNFKKVYRNYWHLENRRLQSKHVFAVGFSRRGNNQSLLVEQIYGNYRRGFKCLRWVCCRRRRVCESYCLELSDRDIQNDRQATQERWFLENDAVIYWGFGHSLWQYVFSGVQRNMIKIYQVTKVKVKESIPWP